MIRRGGGDTLLRYKKEREREREKEERLETSLFFSLILIQKILLLF